MAAAGTSRKHVESFNHNLRLLTNDLAKKCPSDATLSRAQKRISVVISIDPLLAIKKVGPHLYRYRTQIYGFGSGGEQFFLADSFDEELKANVARDKADMVSYIIPRVKECFRSLTGPEKEQYKTIVTEMLDSFVEYTAAVNSL
jgi:hypothetical protein